MAKNTQGRPEIGSIETGDAFKRWYWLKSELVDYCKSVGIPYGAGKFELVERIAHYKDTGEIKRAERKVVTSDFDWGKAPLALDTVITDSYKNTQNMRQFMKKHVGDSFSFRSPFMRWMEANVGKTLSEAVEAWHDLEAERNAVGYQSKILHHNQYNQYIRDFFEANPDKTREEADLCWAYKRNLPSDDGRHRYDPSDLVALEEQ
ncbi:MAG: DUF6434 domain-containing protein [Chloroflexota bacterium]